jgi:hypothetical protein
LFLEVGDGEGKQEGIFKEDDHRTARFGRVPTGVFFISFQGGDGL